MFENILGTSISVCMGQEALELNTRMRNWSGTLLRATSSAGEAKSSICKATAYEPVRPVAEYWSVHYNGGLQQKHGIKLQEKIKQTYIN